MRTTDTCKSTWLLMTVVLTVIGGPATLASERVIRLRREASTSGSKVMLRDVATVVCQSRSERQRAEQIVVATLPDDARQAEIELSNVRRRLTGGGLNLSLWQVRGSTRCVVTRPAEALGRRTPSASGDIHSDSLRWRLHEHIGRQLGVAPEDLELRFSRSGKKVLGLREPEYGFRFREERMRGTRDIETSMIVEVLEAGKLLDSVSLLIKVRIQSKVLVAARTINKGETVHGKMVRVEKRLFGRPPTGVARDARSVVNQQAKQTIKAGHPIKIDYLTPPLLVRKNRVVRVSFHSGSLTIQTSGTAIENGALGATITVRRGRGSNAQLIPARVIGESTVELLGGGAPSQLAKAERRSK